MNGSSLDGYNGEFMRAGTSTRRVFVATLATAAVLVGAIAFVISTTAQAQVVTDFNLAITDGGLPAAGGSSDVTLGIDPGQSTIAAVGATVTYDDALVAPTGCVVLVGLGACNLDTAGLVRVQTVDASGWASPTDLFRVTFTSVALVDSTPLTLSVTEAYDVAGTLIAGDVDDGELVFRVNGDVNCTGTRTVSDALFIAQFVVGNRDAATSCPLVDPATELNITWADVNLDGRISTLDALRVAQCTVGLFDCEA